MNIIQYLITELGCDPSMVDCNGQTVLHLAAIKGHTQIVQWLLRDKQVDILAIDKGNNLVQ